MIRETIGIIGLITVFILSTIGLVNVMFEAGDWLVNSPRTNEWIYPVLIVGVFVFSLGWVYITSKLIRN